MRVVVPSSDIWAKSVCWALVGHVVSSTVTTVVISLTLQAILTYGVKAQECNHISLPLGSVDDYVRDKKPGLIHDVPELGIEVQQLRQRKRKKVTEGNRENDPHNRELERRSSIAQGVKG